MDVLSPILILNFDFEHQPADLQSSFTHLRPRLQRVAPVALAGSAVL
jgi:hypothetical protein